MILKFVYFLIPFNLFCAYSTELQFGSTIKLFFTTLFLFTTCLIAKNIEKNIKSIWFILLFVLFVYPAFTSFAFAKSFDFLQYSNLVFLVFVAISFNADLLKVLFLSFSASTFFLLPLAYFMKENNNFGNPAGNANCIGQLACIGLISNFYLIYKKELSFWLIPISSALVIGCFWFLIDLKSRGSFLLILVAVLVMFIVHYLKKNETKLTCKHYLIGGISCSFLILGIFIYFLQADLSAYANMHFRQNLWQSGLHIFQDNWLKGIGSGNIGRVLPRYWEPNTSLLAGAGETEYHLHNEFLNIAVEGGLISLLLFLTLIFCCIYNGLKYYVKSHHKNTPFVLPLIAIFIGICAQISFDRILQFPTTGLIFALFCGVLLSLNESFVVMPKKSFRILFLVLTLMHVIFAWPFLYQQILYVNAPSNSPQVLNKIETLNNEFNKATSPQSLKDNFIKRLGDFPESSLKRSAIENFKQKQDLSPLIVTSYVATLIDLEFNWSKNLEKILSFTYFPDLKVMTYKKYMVLLSLEGRDKEMLQLALKMRTEFPLVLESTNHLYEYYCNAHEYDKALAILKETAQITNNPLLKRKIILHQMKFDKIYDFEKIQECIFIRKNIEYDPKYVKKNLTSRFYTLDSYYIKFILELLERKEFEKSRQLLIEYSRDDKLIKKPIYKEFMEEIKNKYPEMYEKFQLEINSKK